MRIPPEVVHIPVEKSYFIPPPAWLATFPVSGVLASATTNLYSAGSCLRKEPSGPHTSAEQTKPPEKIL